MIGTDSIDCWISNYHTIMTAPYWENNVIVNINDHLYYFEKVCNFMKIDGEFNRTVNKSFLFISKFNLISHFKNLQRKCSCSVGLYVFACSIIWCFYASHFCSFYNIVWRVFLLVYLIKATFSWNYKLFTYRPTLHEHFLCKFLKWEIKLNLEINKKDLLTVLLNSPSWNLPNLDNL
jgi:hypothetical protein